MICFVQDDWSYQLELMVRFEGYQVDAVNDSDKNPFLAVEMIR